MFEKNNDDIEALLAADPELKPEVKIMDKLLKRGAKKGGLEWNPDSEYYKIIEAYLGHYVPDDGAPQVTHQAGPKLGQVTKKVNA